MSLLDRPASPHPLDLLPPRPTFALVSDDFTDGGALPDDHVYGPVGSDVSPHLAWSGYPEQTQSFVVTCFDPDAPNWSGFWHWALVDVPGSVRVLPRGAGSGEFVGLPAGAYHVRNDWGTKNYGGALPPEGDSPHRYVFCVHALDVPKLDINEETTPALAAFSLAFHVLARGVLTVTYQR